MCSFHKFLISLLRLSVASGIAPYRGTKNAIWSQYVLDWGTKKKFKRNPQKWYFISLSYTLFIFSTRWNDYWLRTHETLLFIDALPNNGHVALANISKIANIKIMFRIFV